MKLLSILEEKDISKFKELTVSGFILPLTGWSSDYKTTFTLDEALKIKEACPDKLCFLIMNRFIFEKDLLALEKLYEKIEQSSFMGILFYDDAILQLKKEKNYKTPLYYAKTHMAMNSDTLLLYQNEGATGAVLSSSITLDEIKAIRKKVTMPLMTLLMGYPIVAFSKRYLIKNNQYHLKKDPRQNLEIVEPKTGQTFMLTENEFGTSFLYKKRFNGSKILSLLDDIKIEYGILQQDDLSFSTYKKLCCLFKENKKREIDELIGQNRGFLYRKTEYRVK